MPVAPGLGVATDLATYLAVGRAIEAMRLAAILVVVLLQPVAAYGQPATPRESPASPPQKDAGPGSPAPGREPSSRSSEPQHPVSRTDRVGGPSGEPAGVGRKIKDDFIADPASWVKSPLGNVASGLVLAFVLWITSRLWAARKRSRNPATGSEERMGAGGPPKGDDHQPSLATTARLRDETRKRAAGDVVRAGATDADVRALVDRIRSLFELELPIEGIGVAGRLAEHVGSHGPSLSEPVLADAYAALVNTEILKAALAQATPEAAEATCQQWLRQAREQLVSFDLDRFAALELATDALTGDAATILPRLQAIDHPEATRHLLLLLLDRGQYEDAADAAARRVPHIKWCTPAISAYVHAGRDDDARRLVDWSLGQPGNVPRRCQLAYAQACVELADRDREVPGR